MSVCRKCDGFGFIDSITQGYPIAIPFSVIEMADNFGKEFIFQWMDENEGYHQVIECPCCGDGDRFSNVRGDHEGECPTTKPTK